MAHKFVIIKTRVRMSAAVDFHRQLVSSTEQNVVQGGGWWHYDPEKNELTFYSKSEDFGQFSRDDLRQCVQYGGLSTIYYQNMTKIFCSMSLSLEDALIHRVEIEW